MPWQKAKQKGKEKASGHTGQEKARLKEKENGHQDSGHTLKEKEHPKAKISGGHIPKAKEKDRKKPKEVKDGLLMRDDSATTAKDGVT